MSPIYKRVSLALRLVALGGALLGASAFAGTPLGSLASGTGSLASGLGASCQPTGQAGSTNYGPGLAAFCQHATQSTAQQAQVTAAQSTANANSVSGQANAGAAATNNALNAQTNASGMVNSPAAKGKAIESGLAKGMSEHLNQVTQGLQQYIQGAIQEADQLQAEGQRMVRQGQMMQMNLPTRGDGVMMENFGNQKLEQAKDLRDFANNVDQNVNQQLEAQKPLYDSRASESLLEAGKLDGNASAASTNAEGLGSLAQAAQAMGKGGGGSGGGSASPGVSGYNGLNTGIDKTESFRLASSGGGGTSSASMASPSDFFKKGNGEFTAGFGSGAKSSSPDATTASVANLKEKLQAERAARNAARQADGSAASGGSASTGEGALGPEGNGTLASSVSAGGMPIGSGMGDLGLSIGLGDPKFDDAMKSMLGLGTEEGALSEEERALLASRRLASLDGTLPPEVLAADSATLFERTRDRIKISLQRGNILGGLGAKLK